MVFEELELLVEERPHGAALNMAIDERLLELLTLPLLRVYRWEREAVSFGYFEAWEAVEAAFPGRELIRRWTGGGVVPHGDGVDWTYSLLVPRSHPFMKIRAAETYCLIHQHLADAIAVLLPEQQATLTCSDHDRLSRACFENPVRHDLLVDDRKIAGAAQRRTRLGLLHQGSVQSLALPAAMADTLAAGLARCVIFHSGLSTETLAEAEALSAVKYATPEWNRRL